MDLGCKYFEVVIESNEGFENLEVTNSIKSALEEVLDNKVGFNKKGI